MELPRRTIQYTNLSRSIRQIIDSIISGDDKYTKPFVNYPEPQ